MLNWLFGKPKDIEVNLSRIGLDLHSHLIPGIDDGVETIEESLSMIRKMKRLGYDQIFTTPHVIWDCYRNTPERILDGLQEIKSACLAAGIDIHISAAAEYFIDEHFVDMLNKGEKLLTLPGNRLLVELPYSTPLMNTSETLFAIVEKGFIPVLAHPERYTYFYSDPSVYQRLVNQGCELQVNVLSLGSYYGENVHKMANWLLKQKLISYLGSDAHRIQHLHLIGKGDKQNWLSLYPFQNKKLMAELKL